MTLQRVINNIFRQNWSDHAVLGRSLYGATMLVLGLIYIFDVTSYLASAPAYLPFPSFFIILAGSIFVVSGFFILANIHVRQAAYVLVTVFFLSIIFVYVPGGHLIKAVQTVAFASGALIVSALARRELEAEEEEAVRTEVTGSEGSASSHAA